MTSPHVPHAGPERDLASLQREICARVRDFDIAPLLDLLATMGYRPDDVVFRGHITETPQPTLVHAIEFTDVDGTIAGPGPLPASSAELGSVAELAADASLTDASRAVETAAAPGAGTIGQPAHVTITVNLGLLSCRSPLPSYFQHLLRDAAFRDPVVELLRLIDRNLLSARLTCDRPERAIAQWREITSDLLRIHGLDSLIGLSWLFRHVFPELPVLVQRTSEQLRVPYAAARLGFSELGGACLGTATRIDVHDFQVTLTSEESQLRPGVPWLHEVDRRLRTIVFPALDPVCMNLTVVLEIEPDTAVAALHDQLEPERDSYLGVDPLGRSGRTVAAPPLRRVVLYRGLLPRDQPDTDELERALVAQAAVTVAVPSRVARGPGDDGDGDGGDDEDTQVYGAPARDRDCELDLTLDLGGHVHRYQATVRWGVRTWFRDEPYAIELRCDHLIQAAPSPRHHPRVWSLLRNHAREARIAELAATTLAHYGATAVSDAIVADLLARGQDAALHALLAHGATSKLSHTTWERVVRTQP